MCELFSFGNTSCQQNNCLFSISILSSLSSALLSTDVIYLWHGKLRMTDQRYVVRDALIRSRVSANMSVQIESQVMANCLCQQTGSTLKPNKHHS